MQVTTFSSNGPFFAFFDAAPFYLSSCQALSEKRTISVCAELSHVLPPYYILRFNYISGEAISKVIQKMAKMASQKTAKGSLKLLPAG